MEALIESEKEEEKTVEAKIDRLDAKIDHLAAKNGRLEAKIDHLNRKIDKIYEVLIEFIEQSPLSPSSSSSSSSSLSTFSTPKWWQIMPLLQHPLSQPIEIALMHFKAKITEPNELKELLYNPCRGSLPSNKKKGQTTAHSPLIPFLLHQAGFPTLLTGYTEECSQVMYEKAVSTLRAMWNKQRKRHFPELASPRTGGAGVTCHENDCQWFQKHYGGLEKVNFSQIMSLILNRTPPALQESSSSNDNLN